MPATIPLIDTHAHILPGMDDGPKGLEESIRMARIAVQDGIHTMIATPHCFNGVYSSSKEAIISACDQFNDSLKENQTIVFAEKR
jgi:protein-tyrosine phosphatase